MPRSANVCPRNRVRYNLKTEDPEESYHDIKPLCLPKLRLKVATFKVELARLLKRDIDIIFILPCS